MTEVKTVRVLISGRVQGVGFRYWVENTATALGVSGWVRNLRDGSVEAVYSGDVEAVDRMVAESRRGPRHANVDRVRLFDCAEAPDAGFRIERTA